jgi:hypothetical protein
MAHSHGGVNLSSGRKHVGLVASVLVCFLKFSESSSHKSGMVGSSHFCVAYGRYMHYKPNYHLSALSDNYCKRNSFIIQVVVVSMFLIMLLIDSIVILHYNCHKAGHAKNWSFKL